MAQLTKLAKLCFKFILAFTYKPLTQPWNDYENSCRNDLDPVCFELYYARVSPSSECGVGNVEHVSPCYRHRI